MVRSQGTRDREIDIRLSMGGCERGREGRPPDDWFLETGESWHRLKGERLPYGRRKRDGSEERGTEDSQRGDMSE